MSQYCIREDASNHSDSSSGMGSDSGCDNGSDIRRCNSIDIGIGRDNGPW